MRMNLMENIDKIHYEVRSTTRKRSKAEKNEILIRKAWEWLFYGFPRNINV